MVKDKFGKELKIGDKFKRDHGEWKDKDVFTVDAFVFGDNVKAKEDGLHSAPKSVYKWEERKFNVGDTVMWVGDEQRFKPKDEHVAEILENLLYNRVKVRFPNITNGYKNGYVTEYHENNFIKWESHTVSTSKRYIIAVEENGKLAPNAKPREYTSLKQAETVALQMAEKHGKRFYVLVANTVAEPPVKPKAELVELV
ncbi:hypothetical protein M2323_004649 [Rhodoblastus acidophilus]|uniref:hypothetical protein n=1 Tax=Rhodoblastus acidophilus TaxID=1074 RepID=UPI0022249A72|nr:hypothetical protein [Rhodoblastus acidophilus]MCW2286653.1 hypothetical protein [Rhodoblastus acidophilus]MCW2335697.1 hypothetical protein [Rhodoblastus acidophilus]